MMPLAIVETEHVLLKYLALVDDERSTDIILADIKQRQDQESISLYSIESDDDDQYFCPAFWKDIASLETNFFIKTRKIEGKFMISITPWGRGTSAFYELSERIKTFLQVHES